ncbi:hypothetical protein R5R73_00075 [Salinicola sp. LHM]|jgi:uncharacterized protein YukE|uniref:hypothetical protein n=1 Tax=Salinicola TaxID=404432 RepID=UPI0008DC84B0|nr:MULTISPECIES: hypothetical protein [Salinicola]MEC8917923.1 hypothetical protein [Pseudomonadota bacterium]MED5499606.1 hypothetical protein [Pseudomonadota bacterium]OHY99613.1 hypothetical protein BC443_08600 [Salinicola sp. MIT1003]WQH33135.1 hypothetical protein R5R73_00075 [Salinicola sp. LHM]
MLQTRDQSTQNRPLADDSGCCQMSSINLLDDSVSTQKEVQDRNVLQLYLLTVQVRALMDVACHQGHASFLTERLRYHTEQLESQFSNLVDKHKGASYTRHFYAQQQQRFDTEIEKIISALESLGEKYKNDSSR